MKGEVYKFQNISTKVLGYLVGVTSLAAVDRLTQISQTARLLYFTPACVIDWFVNKTDVEFPEESKWLLSLGSKLALPVDKSNFFAIKLIADLEQWVQTISDDKEKDIVRSKIANRILTNKRTNKNNLKEKFILNIYKDTKNFLKRHGKNIIITKSDKGNKTVVMYRDDYKNGMRELLDDKQTYKSCRTDPTQKLLRKNKKLIMEFYKQSYISKYEKFQLTSNSATAPRLYGLPKIHKPNMPLRPIASSFEVPCYNLSKYIGTILKNIILEKYNIKNSLELKVKLDNIYLDEDDILISLVVVSLFTNIPIHLAIKNIMTKWESLQNHTKIPKSQFLKALQFCLNDNNYFIFEDNIYNQTYGMPMGNPLSPTIADIILDTLLESCLTELDQQNIHIKMITKYPIRQKINTANQLISKVITLSDKKFLHKNVKIIRNILTNNGFPINITNNLIDRTLNINPTKQTEKNQSGNIKYFGIPYIPKLTEQKHLQDIINNNEISLAHKPNKTIASLFTQTKTKIEITEQSNVVYEITCTGNSTEKCGKCYIGTTKRSLATRIAEHEGDIKKEKMTTALAQHCIENNHNADLRNVKILDKERRENKRYTLESLRIQQKTTSAINRKEDKDNANANYSIVLL
ncbi:uncharacterized protein LOC142231400 [Haematobia irritans]|uniref:uncharacterized protein LOC142231400 n=1 Tax=Haematobia irritans TaxID=7368 RepID=UPI003F4FC5FF